MKVGKEKYVFNKSNKCRVDVNMYNEVLSKKKKKKKLHTELNLTNLTCTCLKKKRKWILSPAALQCSESIFKKNWGWTEGQILSIERFHKENSTKEAVKYGDCDRIWKKNL